MSEQSECVGQLGRRATFATLGLIAIGLCGTVYAVSPPVKDTTDSLHCREDATNCLPGEPPADLTKPGSEPPGPPDTLIGCDKVGPALEATRARLAHDDQVVREFQMMEPTWRADAKAASREVFNATAAVNSAQASVNMLIEALKPFIVDVRDREGPSGRPVSTGGARVVYSSDPRARALLTQLGAAQTALANAQARLQAAVATRDRADALLRTKTQENIAARAEIPSLQRAIARLIKRATVC